MAKEADSRAILCHQRKRNWTGKLLWFPIFWWKAWIGGIGIDLVTKAKLSLHTLQIWPPPLFFCTLHPPSPRLPVLPPKQPPSPLLWPLPLPPHWSRFHHLSPVWLQWPPTVILTTLLAPHLAVRHMVTKDIFRNIHLTTSLSCLESFSGSPVLSR